MHLRIAHNNFRNARQDSVCFIKRVGAAEGRSHATTDPKPGSIGMVIRHAAKAVLKRDQVKWIGWISDFGWNRAGHTGKDDARHDGVCLICGRQSPGNRQQISTAG